MDLINSIRRKNGCDTEMLRRAEKDPDIAGALRDLRGNLTQALESLSTELYSKPSHFVLELIQNAADNKYADGVTPTLSVFITDKVIVVQCNEVGFNADNVEAICKIGASTKKNQKGLIGEKGIGFKSVFRVADAVYICSTDYTFKLDKNEELGMITPSWSDRYPVHPGWTSFYIHLSPLEDPKVIMSYFEDIKPSLLLFLRQLRHMTIEIRMNDGAQNRRIEFSRYHTKTDIVVLEDSRTSQEVFLMVKHMAKTFTEEPKRLGIEESEVVLAFPLTEGGEPKIAQQYVHAFLPVKSFGFPADFLTAANREDILADLPWNKTLRNGIVDAFLKAVKKFQQYPSLEYVWFRFLPDHYSSFLFTVEFQLFRELQQRAIFRSDDGTYRLPSKCIALVQEFQDSDMQPLIPEEFLPDDLHYLSNSYDFRTDGSHFQRLGVRCMSNDDFIAGLKNMNHIICDQPDPWQESVCSRLYVIYDQHQKKQLAQATTQQSAQKPTQDSTISELMQLCILPLSDGSWISANSGNDILFDSTLVGIPQDLGLRLVRTDLNNSVVRPALFRALGVKTGDPDMIATKILELHASVSYPRSRELLIQHARFLFIHRYTKAVPPPTGLRVVDQEGKVIEGTEAYCDFPDVPREVRLNGVLPSPAKFLHPDYLLHQDWWRWLRDDVGVNNFPRLVDCGELSPEFLALTRTIDTRLLLILLKETWPQWQASLSDEALSKLGEINVTSKDGKQHTLKKTYIKRGQLKKYPHLPFLPLNSPGHRDWDFLSDLGVMSRVDADFFIERLIRLSDEGSDDDEAIQAAYEQIQARFEDNPSKIRTAFEEKPLIFASPDKESKKKWIAKSDAIWKGPQSIKSKIALMPSCWSFQKLFRDQLGIAAASPKTLVDELQALGKEWRGKIISPTISDNVSALLADISKLMSETEPYDRSPSWLSNLTDEAIFPVATASGELILCDCDEHFYVPDSNGRYASVFGCDIPLLSLAAPVVLHHIKPVLNSSFFESRLKHLGRAVNRIASPKGRRRRNAAVRDNITGKFEFIQRLVARNPHPTRQAVELIRKLRAVDVFTVESIESTYTLDDHTHMGREEVAVEQEGNGLSILLSANSLSQCDVFICKELAPLLEVDMSTLLIILTFPPEMVELTLKTQGILDVPEDLFRDKASWIDDANAQVENQGQSTADQKSGVAVASASPARRADLVKQQIRDFVGGVQKMGYDLFQPDRIVTSPFHRGVAFPKRISKNPGVGNLASVGEDTPGSEYRVVNATLGECFIYSVLLKSLPNFGPENWTSKSRAKYPGLTCTADGEATFKYPDCDGAMTSLLYDEETKEAWNGSWPTYYLDVKSTSGRPGEPFWMTPDQAELALRLTVCDSATPPKELYAIVRVSNVRTSPSYAIYSDPHRLVYEGTLRTAWLQTSLNGERWVTGS